MMALKLPKVLIALVAAALLSFVGVISNSYAATTPDEQWTLSGPPTSDPSVGIVIQDSDFLKGSLSNFQAFDSDQPGIGSKVTAVYQCSTTKDLNCDGSRYSQYTATLPRCLTDSQVDCISVVGATKTDGTALSVSYGADFPGVRPSDFKGDPAIALPSGGSSFLVDIPNAPHPGGTKYLVIAQMSGHRGKFTTTFSSPEFQAGIFAVSIINGRYSPSKPFTTAVAFSGLGNNAYQRTILEVGGPAFSFSACAQATDTTCAQPWALPLDIRFSLTFRLSSKIAGWLHGRVANPESSIKTDANQNEIVTVSGNPSIVPIITGWAKKAELPPTLATFYGAHPERYKEGTGFGCTNPNISSGPCPAAQWVSVLRDSVFYDQLSIDESVAWLSAIKDTAPVAPTEWSIRSMGNGADSNCYKDTSTLSGILTTNATNFLSGPPRFNTADQTLDYKVVAPHFLPNGDVFKGSYNLTIRSDVARCIYGFSTAPIKATVSVIDTSGVSQVATTIINEKDGWLTIRANGFTFSNPIIKVKLSQDAPAPVATPTPEPTASATPTTPPVAPAPKPNVAAKKITITCVKGKTTKTVTAVKPTCPAGYKKK